MKASSKLLTSFSVTGLSLAFAFGCALQLQAQDSTGTPAGSYAAPPVADMTNQDIAPLPGSSHEALLQARQALAAGDTSAAKNMVESARHYPIDNTITSDTPAKVEAMIARHSQLMEMYGTSDKHTYNHGAAMFLLEQADRLLDYRDFGAAELLVKQARGFDVQYKPGDLNPEHVMTRMQQIRSIAINPPRNISGAKLEAGRILSQAQLAFDKGQLDLADQLVAQVKALDLPENVFEDSTILPWELELSIRRARQQGQSIAQAAFGNPNATGTVRQADYYPELDQTRNMTVSGNDGEQNDPLKANDARGKRLYDSGMSALSHGDRKGALEYFRMAWQYKDQLDPASQQDLQSKLSELQTRTMNASFNQEEIGGIDEDLRRQMFSDVLRQRSVAQRMVEQRNPRGALNHMRLVRDNIAKSELDEAGKKQLMQVIEREIAEMERFIEQNIGEIENDETNAMRLNSVADDRIRRDDLERKIQQLVNDHNHLLDEQRYSEAAFLARQAFDLAPENLAVIMMMEKSQLQANMAEYDRIQEAKEIGFVDTMRAVDEAAIPSVDTNRPIEFSQNTWDRLARRDVNIGAGNASMSERERVIWSALKNQTIQAEFNRTPLSEAINILAERAGVNMIPDIRAMEMEQVSIDTPVTMSLSQPISIESALNIILGNNKLVFKVENESVIITNRQALQANPESQTYYVGDLVVPVPDFSGNALNMQFLGPQNQAAPWSQSRMNNGFAGMNQGGVKPVSYNQQMPNGGMGFDGGGPAWTGSAMPHTPSGGSDYNMWGPKGVGEGGITEQDFEELMDLIQETIDPDSWEANGGNGRMQPFPSTLSLIITQTQENQDRIQNLLTRLRELNDVQIVVEVRFITLSDDFFERIGVDLDLEFNDNSGLTPATITDNASDNGGRQIIGRLEGIDPFFPRGDLDIPFTQGGFGRTIPSFGGAGNLQNEALNFGFAILSDIEVYFLLQAAKGDTRSNVTQAPTVTMFNGQSATVFSGELRPFVTSIRPVVGDFAAAQQPIITILPEGTQLNVRAVASADRRFVKMTLVPFFSQITQVDTFQFEGSRTIRRGGGTNLEDILDAITGNPGDPLSNDELEVTESGTTVQLPVFANTTITTTVSVPDGGTVLLGGIKTMQEERIEQGVPFLSNIPYVNRLFKNVGIGRSTASLMMMVTPRIIIQEEEEARQVNTTNN